MLVFPSIEIRIPMLCYKKTGVRRMRIRTPPPDFHYQRFFINFVSAISAVSDLPAVPMSVLPSVPAAPASRRSQSPVQITLLSSPHLPWRCGTAGWRFPSALCQGRKLLFRRYQTRRSIRLLFLSE